MIRRSSCDIIFASNDEYLEEEHFELRPVWCQFHLAEELDELVAMGADRDEMYKLLVEPKDNPYHDTHYSFVEPFDYSHRDFVYVKSTFVVQDWIMEGMAVFVNAELRAFDFDDEFMTCGPISITKHLKRLSWIRVHAVYR